MNYYQEKQIVESIAKAYRRYLENRDGKKGENVHMREVEGMIHIIAILNIPYETEWDIDRKQVKRLTIGNTTAIF